MSILKSVLATGRGRVALVYANRDDQSVIFTSELRKLAGAAGGRLVVMHWLDSLQGIPTAAGIAALAEPYATWQPYICGPDPFLTVVRAALAQLGVPAKRIRAERFLSLAENPFEQSPPTGGPAATLTVDLDGATHTLPWPPGARMLDVLITAGLTAPYSCRQGICGACACQLTAGEVEMAHNEVLEAARPGRRVHPGLPVGAADDGCEHYLLSARPPAWTSRHGPARRRNHRARRRAPGRRPGSGTS